MNKEKKQHLIQHCEDTIAKYKFAVENLEPSEEEADSYPETIAEFKLIISTHEIALAALNAQPIKLPKIKHPAQFDYADEVIECLKSHNIEVQE